MSYLFSSSHFNKSAFSRSHLRKSAKSSTVEYRCSDVSSKQLRPPCGSHCRVGCSAKIDEAQRRQIFHQFWRLTDIVQQRDFLIEHMDQIVPRYRYQLASSKRSLNYSYNFVVNNVRIKVCQTFFLNTLDISRKMVTTAVRKYYCSDNPLLNKNKKTDFKANSLK